MATGNKKGPKKTKKTKKSSPERKPSTKADESLNEDELGQVAGGTGIRQGIPGISVN
jgi:hypothetical protein